jgi:hypothetical protein
MSRRAAQLHATGAISSREFTKLERPSRRLDPMGRAEDDLGDASMIANNRPGGQRRDHIDKQARARGPWGKPSRGANGQGAHFGAPDNAVGRSHLDQGPVKRAWPSESRMRAGAKQQGRSSGRQWASDRRVRQISSQEWHSDWFGDPASRQE